MNKQKRIPKQISIISNNYNTFKDLVKPYLLKMSDNHCSYCDEYFFNVGNLLVEHFQNKKDFPKLTFEWNNLFIACNSCNSRKRDKQYSENPSPIKPDEDDYSFSRHCSHHYADFFNVWTSLCCKK